MILHELYIATHVLKTFVILIGKKIVQYFENILKIWLNIGWAEVTRALRSHFGIFFFHLFLENLFINCIQQLFQWGLSWDWWKVSFVCFWSLKTVKKTVGGKSVGFKNGQFKCKIVKICIFCPDSCLTQYLGIKTSIFMIMGEYW